MYLHVVLMAFNKEVTIPLRARVEHCFRETRRECKGVMRFDLVDNHSRTSAAHTHALISVFADVEALDSYRASAAHERLMAELRPHLREIVVLDTPLEAGRAL